MSEQEQQVESLSSVFEGMPFGGPVEKAEPAKVEPVKAEPVKAEPAKAEAEPAKEAVKPAVEPVKEPEKPRADVAAIMDERRKRQALEAKVRELESKPEVKPSVFDDEDKAISSRVAEGTRGLREMLYKQSVKTARILYKEAYSDAESAFMEAAEADPRLYEGLRSCDDPGEYIYSVGLQIRELADVGGDFIKYREKVTAQGKAELDALKAQFDALKAENEALKTAQKDLEAIPRSLNTTSLTPAKGQEEDDEEPQSFVRFGNKRS